MLKIATHNSCTGEKGKGLLSFLVTPFARCQGKKIYEQFRESCRLFDIRATVCRDGQYRPAHGLWTCRRTIPEILAELDMLAATDAEHPTYITMTYEHVNNYQAGFISEVKGWMAKFPHIHFVEKDYVHSSNKKTYPVHSKAQMAMQSCSTCSNEAERYMLREFQLRTSSIA